MSTRSRALGLALAVALSLGAAGASADVPPGPPPDIRPCTAAAQQQATERCELCAAAHNGDVEACMRKYQGSAFNLRCTAGDPPNWNELWCRPLRPNEPRSSAPSSRSSGGCASCALGAQNDRVAFLALFATAGLFGVALARKRR